MRVGLTVATFQTDDWDRVNAKDWSRQPTVPDHVVMDGTIRLGSLAEPLGFDSIWVGEHFGTPYSMWPDATQSLAFWAGRTERVDFGTCVIVLPWHNPVWLAHRIAMLDILLEGRRVNLGLGRGVAASEFSAINVERGESRQRFKETLEILRLALTHERFSYDGEIFHIEETSVRPRPRHQDLLEHLSCAFTTPESMEVAASEGLSQLFVTGAPLEQMSEGVRTYNTIRAQRGLGPDQPTVLLWMYCAETADAAEEAADWFHRYELDVATHYGLRTPGAFDGVKGYEAYAAITRRDRTASHGAAGLQLGAQPIGTPDEIIRRMQVLIDQTGAKEIACIPQYGAMPFDKAEASMRLFAKEVIPALQAMQGTPVTEEPLAQVSR